MYVGIFAVVAGNGKKHFVIFIVDRVGRGVVNLCLINAAGY